MSDTILVRTKSDLSGARLDTLFIRMRRHGDRDARDAIVEHYLPLAYKLARRYRGAREPIGDLRQVAAMGLIKAVDRYDIERPNGFVAYAVPSILGELRRYFRDSGWSVHVPRGAQELALKVEQARRALDGEHPVVTAPLIAEYLEISLEDVLEAMEANYAHHASSLDAPSDDGEESSSVGAMIGTTDHGFAAAEMSADIARASGVLSDRERDVLSLRFSADMTQSEIGSELGVSQMQVSRILRRALDHLAEEMDPELAKG